MVELIGRTLGPYHLIERLDRGTPYTTFRAIDTRLFNQPAAVTVFDVPPGDDDFLHRFEHLAETLTDLRHPNILPLQDFGEAGGLAYVGTPYLEGATLATILGRPQRLEEVLRLAATTGDALDYAHRRGLVHGGIAPGAIQLLNLPPREESLDATWPLLGDFGFAQIAGSLATAHPALAPYQPPERGPGVDRVRADLYALAGVLVAALIGAPPTLDGVGRGAALGTELAATLDRALALDPGDRYSSGAELMLALSEAVVADGREQHESAAPLLEEARAAVTDGTFRAASQAYGAYLRLRPDDELARRELATLESRRAESLRRRVPAAAGEAAATISPGAAPAVEAPAAADERPTAADPATVAPAVPPATGANPEETTEATGGQVAPSPDRSPSPTRWRLFRRRGTTGGVPPPTPPAPAGSLRPALPLRPLVSPARERQRLVLPSAIGALVLTLLLVFGGSALSRWRGNATENGTATALVRGGAPITGAAPGTGTAGPLGVASSTAGRPAATNVPATLPVAPTSTPQLPTPVPTLPPLPPVLEDSFFDQASGFPLRADGREGSGYQNGEYVILVPEPDGYTIADLAGREFGDLALEVDARTVGPSLGGGYGLAFHRQIRGGSIDQYFALLDPEAGTVRLVRWSGNERAELVPPTPHPAIARGEETNRLVVIVKGTQVTIQVNGVQVAQIVDLAGPSAGLIALRADAGTGPIEVHFGHLTIRPAR